MKLETGNTYLMLDGTEVAINFVKGTRTKLFRTNEADRYSWFEDGTHSTGKDSLELVVKKPDAVKKGVLKLEIDLDTLVVTVVQ